MSPTSLVEPEWLRTLSERQPKAAELLSRSTEEQRRLGYFHTLREICQQPATWLRTSALMQGSEASIRPALAGIASLTLTDLRAWRDRLVKGRTKSTANRIIANLKAALNHAYADEQSGIATDAAGAVGFGCARTMGATRDSAAAQSRVRTKNTP